MFPYFTQFRMDLEECTSLIYRKDVTTQLKIIDKFNTYFHKSFVNISIYIWPTPFYRQEINYFIIFSMESIFACLILKMLIPSKLSTWWRGITLEEMPLFLQTKTNKSSFISWGASRLAMAARFYCWYSIFKVVAYWDIVTSLYVTNCLKNVLGKRCFKTDWFGWITNLFSKVMFRALC